MMVVQVYDSSQIWVIHYCNTESKPESFGSLPEQAQEMCVQMAAAAASSTSSPFTLASIVEECISLNVYNSIIELLTYPDGEDVYKGQEAIDRARERLGEKDYKLLSNNCESFLNWAITGKEVTNQGTTAKKAIAATSTAAIGIGLFAVVGAIGYGSYTAISGGTKEDDDD